MKIEDRRKIKQILKLGKGRGLTFSPLSLDFLKTKTKEEIQDLLNRVKPNSKVLLKSLKQLKTEKERIKLSEVTLEKFLPVVSENNNRFVNRYQLLNSKFSRKYTLALYRGNGKYELMDESELKIIEKNEEDEQTNHPFVLGGIYTISISGKLNPLPVKKSGTIKEIKNESYNILFLSDLFLDSPDMFDIFQDLLDLPFCDDIKMIVIFGNFLKNYENEKRFKDYLKEFSKQLKDIDILKKIVFIPYFGPTTASINTDSFPVFPIAEHQMINDSRIEFQTNPTKALIHRSNNEIVFFRNNYNIKDPQKLCEMILHNYHLLPETKYKVSKKYDHTLFFDKVPNTIILCDRSIGPFSRTVKNTLFINVPSLKTEKCVYIDAYKKNQVFWKDLQVDDEEEDDDDY